MMVSFGDGMEYTKQKQKGKKRSSSLKSISSGWNNAVSFTSNFLLSTLLISFLLAVSIFFQFIGMLTPVPRMGRKHNTATTTTSIIIIDKKLPDFNKTKSSTFVEVSTSFSEITAIFQSLRRRKEVHTHFWQLELV